MQDSNKLIVIDDNNQEIEMDIIFTFDDDNNKRRYVLYANPADEDGQVFASRYDDEGNLFPVDDEKEWAMVEEVFNAYVDEFGNEEEN